MSSVADYTRLFGRFPLQHRGGRKVAGVRLRLGATLPPGTVLRITDVQLQPGRFVTGWTLHPSDLGVEPVGGWSWRNAVVSGRRDLVVAADTEQASPTLFDVRGNASRVRLGAFHMGAVAGAARVDGFERTATQGAGIPPHLTRRADVDVPALVEGGRALVTCWFRGIGHAADPSVMPPGPPPDPDGTVVAAHPAWGAVLAHHPTWADVLAAHTDWS